MNKIEVKILNPEAVAESEKMMVCAARLTQRGEKIKNMDDFMDLYNKSYTENTVRKMAELPHNNIRQFGMVSVAVVGASRRFLAQITRRRVGVTFTSASLQYSDYSDEADFVVPYEILKHGGTAINSYISMCRESMSRYKDAVDEGLSNDSAGYMAPQGLRNILIISATIQAWTEMIGQRICRRNTDETRYVMLRIWHQLKWHSPRLFSSNTAGAFCMRDKCQERDFSCKNPMSYCCSPDMILLEDFPLLVPE